MNNYFAKNKKFLFNNHKFGKLLENNYSFSKYKFNKYNRFYFSSNQLYLWLSNVNPGIRVDDYKNKLKISSTPIKIDFFDDKDPQYVYCGPRSSAVITCNGDVYTFGSGNWGVLGHGDEKSISHNNPKLIEYFKNNNIKIKKICIGDFHSIALSDKGEVYSWGFGGEKGFLGIFRRDPGAIGHGDWKHYFTPKKIKYFNENNIVIKDISCGVSHSVAISTEGKLYNFGKGGYGVLGTGSNSDSSIPIENELFTIIQKEDINNQITKIDCAGEYTGALTIGGDLYVWGKNNHGQLAIGSSGIGVDVQEGQSYPTIVPKPVENMKIVNFDCGENGMMVMDDQGKVYKSGWRLDYNLKLFEACKNINVRNFFCGNSYYCMLDTNNNIYQWGSLFKNKLGDIYYDVIKINNSNLFDNKIIKSISGKFKVCAAITQINNTNANTNDDKLNST